MFLSEWNIYSREPHVKTACGDSRPRLSVEQSSTGLWDQPKTDRANRLTATGGTVL